MQTVGHPYPDRWQRISPIVAGGLLLLLLLCPSGLWLLQNWDQPLITAAHGRPDPWLPLLLSAAGLATAAALLGRVRRLILLLLPALLVAPFEIFYAAKFAMPSGPHVYGVILDTDRAEALAWLGAWLWPALLVVVSVWVVIGLACWILWRRNACWRHRSRHWVWVGGLLLATTVLLIASGQAALDRTMQSEPTEQDAEALPAGEVHDLFGHLEASYPWGLPLRLAHFRAHLQSLERHRARVAGFDFGVRWPDARTRDADGREIHVLVIGETGRPDRWQLFGAERQTTPRLVAREGLVALTDAVSAASATRESVPMMLTRRPPSKMLAITDEPSVLTAFRQAGFRTYWLSNQGQAGTHETPVSVLAREADEQHFINPTDYRGAGALDGDLLPLVEAILARHEQRRQLIVLHMLGSHLHYANRYPKEFEYYRPALRPADAPDIWRRDQAVAMRNSYDNSVRYTDLVLDRVIELLHQSGARTTLTYAADHGETLFDGGCDRAGHGFAALVNYRVPMFVWASASWRAARPEAWRHLLARRTDPVSTLALPATLIDLAGFEIAAPHAHAALTQAPGAPAPRRLLHFGDFDRQLPRIACDRPGRASPG